jgi:putative phage-type endonuclease
MTTRDQWLQARRKGLGGSDMAAIMGLSPHRSAWDVFSSKLGIVEPEEDTPERTRGRRLERAVLEWAAEDAHAELDLPEPNSLVLGPTEPALGSPDGYLQTPEGYWGIEAKTARDTKGWGPHGSDVVPIYYAIQCQWYAYVCRIERWDLAVFFPISEDWRRYTIMADRKVARVLADRAAKWWQDHIVARVPPPLDASDAAAAWLLQRYPVPVSGMRTATLEEEALAVQFHQLKAQSRALEEKEKDLRNRLVERIGDAEGIYWANGKATWKDQGRSHLDVKALTAAHPMLAEQFRRESRIRVLRTTLKDEGE